MAYYGYQPYQMYQPPMADQLMQLRQNQYQPNMQQAPQQQPSPSIVWVQNEMEAANYLVAPNSAVTLWDSNSPVVYLKQADASGKPSMKIYDLVERTQRPVQPPKTPAIEYAPLSRLEALEARLNELTAVKESPKSAKRTTTKEDAE
mgnify:CR=1 FL=1